MDRLSLLHTFRRIAERGSSSAAARDLGLSQASASRQLARLERDLGATLVLRTTHDLSLTRTGQAVLARARSLLGEWDALEESAREDTDAPLSGAMRIAAPVALGQLHLTSALLAFAAAHPALSLSWLLTDAEQRVAEAGLDLWVLIGVPADDTLIVERVGMV
ncbi:MAG: LysR family transcriptional regulator, partial [Litorimonas sp.]